MADQQLTEPQKLNWRFPSTFWYANGAELFERAAFYGMFITLYRYLNQYVGFSDVQTGYITAAFASILYFLPTFMGIMADKIGFKSALILAFMLLTGGYGLLGAYQLKATALISLTLIVFGGAIIKPVISGTVAKCSDSAHRARAMSIFYMVVNIGSFTGKGLAGELNELLGLQYINFYAAGMSFAALILVAIFYRNLDAVGTGKTVRQALRGLGTVMCNFRFLCLILIIGGFWAIQGQLYASMPTYIERLLGKGYRPEWLANINPFVVVILVVPITNLIRNLKPVSAIGIGLLIIPFTAVVVALGPKLEAVTGNSVNLGLFTMHPLVLVFIIGIALQGLAECFLSPKWLEFASKQAPEGEVGLYLGYSHLTTFFAWLFGFILAGYLLAGFCPDPRTFTPDLRHEWRLATDPEYRFTMTNEQLANLTGDGDHPVPDALHDAFAARDLPLTEDATFEKQPSSAKGKWKNDPEGVWEITSGADTHTIKEVRFDIEEDDRTRKHIELLVYAEQPRAPEDIPPLPSAYDRAHYIWYVFAGIGFVAFFSLLVFKFVTESTDRRRNEEEMEERG